MKTLSIVTVAILLGLSGVAMAGNDNQDSQQSYTNATGPNPYMPEVSTSSAAADSAYAQAPVQHHVVHHHVKR
jgi:hypothetical protein